MNAMVRCLLCQKLGLLGSNSLSRNFSASIFFSLICLCFHLFIIEHVTHSCLFLIPGEDLLAIAADQPFRFPATFTFVVRAFSGTFSKPSQFISTYCSLQHNPKSSKFIIFAVLDGIGKGLDPRFDITEIAKP